MKSLQPELYVAGVIPIFAIPSSNEHTPPSGHEGFGYDENDPLGKYKIFFLIIESRIRKKVNTYYYALGPNHWPEKYSKCAGKYQSPIDIEESLVTRVSMPALNLNHFHEAMSPATITNNGHTGRPITE